MKKLIFTAVLIAVSLTTQAQTAAQFFDKTEKQGVAIIPKSHKDGYVRLSLFNTQNTTIDSLSAYFQGVGSTYVLKIDKRVLGLSPLLSNRYVQGSPCMSLTKIEIWRDGINTVLTDIKAITMPAEVADNEFLR